MKLVEIIILAGTQCASPITPGHLASEVSKVPCAVVIERDTESKSVSVRPPALANHPKVRLALAKPVAPPPLPAAIAPSPAPGPQIAATASAPAPLLAAPPALGAEAGTGQAPQPAAAARIEERKVAALPGQSSGLDETPQVPPLPAAEEPQSEGQPPAVEAQPEPQPPAAEKPKAKANAVTPKRTVKKKSAARVASLAAKPKSAGQCIRPARPVWYTNSAGQKKYRCAKPGAKLSLY